jgi:hypothetical protein
VTSEATVEAYLKHRVECCGGICMKFVSPGLRGVPDRIVIWNGEVCFVEVKKPGEKLSPHQARMHARMRNLGATVKVIDCRDGVNLFIREWFC